MVSFSQLSALQRDCIVRCLQRETTCLQNLLKIMEATDRLDGRYIKESIKMAETEIRSLRKSLWGIDD